VLASARKGPNKANTREKTRERQFRHSNLPKNGKKNGEREMRFTEYRVWPRKSGTVTKIETRPCPGLFVRFANLPRRPGHRAPPEDMAMQVKDTLPRIGALIDHQSISTCGEAQLLGDIASGE
jgi:hypothetical protein